ncbi:MAG: transporter permease [Acidobacteria bacterium]|jgi:putative ABC transport system permease protein|nr:transporter permease [Acidobacteriota bacterium]
MSLLIGALTIGFILSLLALGVYISFRIFDFPDITAEGSITLGAAVTSTLLVAGWSPLPATAMGFVAGLVAGSITGILAMQFEINKLLSGIITMTALYSVNLRIMGRSNIPLLNETTLVSQTEKLAQSLFQTQNVVFLGWEVSVKDMAILLLIPLLITAACILLYLFFRTNLGTAMRATGDNAQMIRALGADDRYMVILGLALSNGLVALSGAVLAQYQGFADVQMGIGMVVWGFASVIIGEALVGTRQLGFAITGAVMGSILFRLLVAVALRWGLNPNDLKLITAAFVFVALILPLILRRIQERKRRLARA